MKPYVILIFLVVIAFTNSLQNSFVWDDYPVIVKNPRIDMPLREIPSIFTTPLLLTAGAARDYYRPILSLYFIVNYKIWGFNPVGFHLTNLLLYIITVLALYNVGLLLFKSHDNGNLISLMGASIFSVHPVNSEMAGRAASGETLLGFFLIVSLYFFLKKRSMISFSAFALALFSKEVAVLFPLVLLIPALYRNGIKKGAAEIIPYVVLVLGYLVLRAVIVDSVIGRPINKPLLTQIITMSAAMLDYVKLFLFPYHILPYYPEEWHSSIIAPKVIFSLFLTVTIIVVSFRLRMDLTMLFLFLAPFIMLSPAIWRVNTIVVDFQLSSVSSRFLYISAMFFSVVLASFLASIVKRKRHLVIGWIMLLVVLTPMTISTNRIWASNVSLFSAYAAEFPEDAVAHNNLGLSYHDLGKLDEAVQEYLIALKITPYIPYIHYNLGNAYSKQGRFGEAINEYLAELQINNTNPDVHFNLGITYALQDRFGEAVYEFQEALRYNPEDVEARKNIGIYSEKMKQMIR